jgi:putative ABC transport system permease protein
MFNSYLKIAVRIFSRHKFFSIANALALALGMSVSLLLISFYSYVSSFDDFHSKKESIYRVITTKENEESKYIYASAPPALAQQLKDESPGIKEITRINSAFQGDVVSDRMNIPVHGYYVDSNFFSLFDFDMIQGNPRNALVKPNSIVLTESVARKFAASGDLLGKAIEIDGLGDFEVTGVIKDQRRTHFMFEVLVSFSSLPAQARGEESNPDQWTRFTDQYVYLLTTPALNKEKLQQSLTRIAHDANSHSNAKIEFGLQALGDITPGPDLENSLGPDSDYLLIVVFATICLLILLPACFNYANLSIARALKRSKEIGLRKTLGGAKIQIFFQFITETVTTVVVSLVGAVLIFMLIRPGFEKMMPGGWLDLSLTWEMLVMFLLFALVTGFLTGVFPAMYFGGLNPIQALKGISNARGLSRMRLRKVLIISQFALSFCFIVLLIVFSRQYYYNLNFDYGFNTENILDVDLQDVKPATLRTEFSTLQSVDKVSMSSGILGLSYSSTYVRQQDSDDSTNVDQIFCDANYVDNMELELLAGQNFPNTTTPGERYILVNEEFLRMRQITSPIDALGKTYFVEGKELEIIGVLKNFHFAPVQIPITSFLLRTDESKYAYANVKITAPHLTATLEDMETIWNKLSVRKFEAHLFDDEMEEMYYRFYRALLKMIGYLGLIAISITLLGLLGMVIYTIEPRAKEVGIRKVFGANESSITYLLSKDFIRLMGWGIGFAIPLSTLLIDDFLSALQYYRVSLNVWDILVSLVVFLCIGVVTIASQIRRATRANPVDILRHE